MSTREELSREIAATVAGISHDANFKDEDGKSTLDQDQAVYQYLPKHNVMVVINHDDTDVEIWYDPHSTNAEWFQKELVPRLKAISRRYLYGATIRSYDGDITPKQVSHRTAVGESRNSTNISYHPLGNTKIRLAHSKPVREEVPGARSRNIKALYIENGGERFRFPYNHLLGARVMALHVESGGKPWDQTGEKILEISRRRKDIMELLRWSKRLDGTEQVDEIRSKGKNEVIMLRRMMERAARTGDLNTVIEFQLPPRTPVTESALRNSKLDHRSIAGLELTRPDNMVAEAIDELNLSIDRLFD
jgi:hypothetical protein